MDKTELPLLEVLTGAVETLQNVSLEFVWQVYQRERASGASPFKAAVLVSSQVDRLGFAFALGYPAALEDLVSGVQLPAAFCVTEAKGNSPRAIETRLKRVGTAHELSGTKTFVTFGSLAETLLVVAKAGDKPDGRPDLVVVQIPSDRAGVVLSDLPKTPFAPEVPHTSVQFEGVDVRPDERLPGDGYLGYVKPFRTVEDIHVVGATLGYLLGLARRSRAPGAMIAELSSSLLTLDSLRTGAPLDPRVHIALHGVYERVTAFLRGPDLERILDRGPNDERERWERDKALLRVASKARKVRFEKAQSELC